MLRIVSQSTPAKNGCTLISSAPWRPKRCSGAQISLKAFHVLISFKLKNSKLKEKEITVELNFLLQDLNERRQENIIDPAN
jgi:hypothetical protein